MEQMEHSSTEDVIHLLAQTVASKNRGDEITIDTLLSDDILNRIIDCLIRNRRGSYPLWIDERHLELTALGSFMATGLITAETAANAAKWLFSSGKTILMRVKEALATIRAQLEYAIRDDMLGVLCGPEIEGDDGKTKTDGQRSADIDTKKEKLLTALLEPFLSKHDAAIITLLQISTDTPRKAGGRRRTRRVHQKKHRIPVQRRNTRRRYRKSARK